MPNNLEQTHDKNRLVEWAVKALLPFKLHENERAVILDVNLAFADKAQILESKLNAKYIGVSSSAKALSNLKKFGVETLTLTSGKQAIEEHLTVLLAERQLLAIVLENKSQNSSDFKEILKAISQIAIERQTPVIVKNEYPYEVNNPKGYDWFSESGLSVIAKSDPNLFTVDLSNWDGNPLLQEKTSIYKLLNSISSITPAPKPVESAWLAVPAAILPISKSSESHNKRPFISVVLRTQGHRLHPLRETLLSLATQSFTDFEVIIVGHSMTTQAIEDVKHLINEFPLSFVSQIRFETVKGGTRSRPLNLGLDLARGQYITFLDDDDYVFANWLEEFKKLGTHSPGKVLRSQATIQWFETRSFKGKKITRALTAMSQPYNDEFSFIQHLLQNQSPFMTLAFPRSLVDTFNFRFDESLTTTEDWDFLLRSAGLLGVENSKSVTAVYRKWKNLKSSDSIASSEWRKNEAVIVRKISNQPVILSQGDVEKFRVSTGNQSELTISSSKAPSFEHLKLIEEIWNIEHSFRWQITAPLRLVSNLFRGTRGIGPHDWSPSDFASAQLRLKRLKASIWWRIAIALSRY